MSSVLTSTDTHGMPFTSPLEVRRTGVDLWELLEPLTYTDPKTGQTITVPAGFATDFASVPQWCQSLLPRTGVCDEAAVVHDMHCVELAASPAKFYGPPEVSSIDTDAMFRRMLIEDGEPAAKAYLYWCGVRWGALVNPARRAGWWRTAPAVLAVTVAALPLAVLAVPLIIGAGLLAVVDKAVRLLTRSS